MKALKDLFAYLWALWSFVLFFFFFFVFCFFVFVCFVLFFVFFFVLFCFFVFFCFLFFVFCFVLFCFFFFFFSFEWKRGPSMWTHRFYVTYHMYHRGFARAIAQKVISLSHFPRTKGYFSLSFFSSFFVDLFKFFFSCISTFDWWILYYLKLYLGWCD